MRYVFVVVYDMSLNIFILLSLRDKMCVHPLESGWTVTASANGVWQKCYYLTLRLSPTTPCNFVWFHWEKSDFLETVMLEQTCIGSLVTRFNCVPR